MTALAVANQSPALVRQEQIGLALERIATVTAETLTEAIGDLHAFVAVLDGLIGSDERWQRELRRSIVNVLARFPGNRSGLVPQKLGLRVLHAMIHRYGPSAALALIDAAETVPGWHEIIRVYQPRYAMGNTKTLNAHQGAVGQARQRRALTVADVHARWTVAREAAEHWERIAELCHDAGLTRADKVPLDILNTHTEGLI